MRILNIYKVSTPPSMHLRNLKTVTLKMHLIFSVHNTMEKFENVAFVGHCGFINLSLDKFRFRNIL